MTTLCVQPGELLPETMVSSIENKRSWIVAGPADALARLDPLISGHRIHRPVVVADSLEDITPHLGNAAGVLLIGGLRRSPRTALPGVFLTAANQRRVPAGWLPDAGDRLANYARSAAEVHSRCARNKQCGPVVLLGQKEQRSLDLTAQIATEIEGSAPVFQWTEERIVRRDLITALGVGPGVTIYCGHSVAAGWIAYGGFDSADVEAIRGHPIGAVLSISCSTSARRRNGLSFSEDMVLAGFTAAALGATGRTLHDQNVELSLALARAFHSPSIVTLADLVSDPGVPAHSLARYRIIGDPLAPLFGYPDATARAIQVFAPGPDDPLPIMPLAAWNQASLH